MLNKKISKVGVWELYVRIASERPMDPDTVEQIPLCLHPNLKTVHCVIYKWLLAVSRPPID